MRTAAVYRNGQQAGVLTQTDELKYEFRYMDDWFFNTQLPAISLTLPKSSQVYHSDHLFPFFFNMLSEGVNRQLQSKHLRIDENDHFGLLLATAGSDTIGAITIFPLDKS